MLSSFYNQQFTVKVLTEYIDSKKIVRKSFSDGATGKCALTVLNQSKLFQNDKETIEANYLMYCAPIAVKLKDKVQIGAAEYEVVQILTDIMGDHKELYLRNYKNV